MQQVKPMNTNASPHSGPIPAAYIPKTGHAEAAALATAELERFLTVLDSLSGDDWTQPTACTEWNVKDIAAHEAGWLNAMTGLNNIRKLFSNDRLKQHRAQGKGMLDSSNQAQVDMRAGHTPAQVIAELRDVGPRAIAFRKRLPALIRALPFPDPDTGKWMTVGYLTDTIFPRDMWMHRHDVCTATGREFIQTPEHDGRVVALVVRDLARNLKPVLDGESVVYTLTGVSGGSWHIGANPNPAATLTMDVMDFNLLASERWTAQAMLDDKRVTLSGDEALARRVLDHTIVLY